MINQLSATSPAGMHGGKMFLRGNCSGIKFPSNVTVRTATNTDIEEIKGYLSEFCDEFGFNRETILSEPFTVIMPDSKNPYKQMYVAN